ncbi:6-bladed beta-propeller [Maribellus comscasis]|nr:6-bladed beta-propeller [Maribellus comscasis]
MSSLTTYLKSTLFFLVIVFVSCQSKTNREKNEFSEVENYEIDLKSKNINSLNDILSFEKFVFLETIPEALIHSISRLCITDNDELIVFDERSQKIILFSNEGKFIRTIAKKGNGPHELNIASDISYDNSKDYIYVLTQGKSIKIFNSKGEFVKRIKIDIYGTSIANFENLLLVHNIAEYDNMKHSLAVLDLDGEIKEKYLLLPEKKSNFNYQNRNNFVKTNSGVRYLTSFDYSIYSYSSQGLKTKYCFDFLSNSAPPNYVSTLNTQKEFNVFKESLNYVHSITTFLEMGDWIYLEVIFNHRTYSIYINTKTKEIKKYMHKNLHDLFVQVALRNIHGDRFISAFYPYFIRSEVNYKFRLDYAKGKIDESIINEFKKIIAMKVDENPVVIFSKPKF